MRPDDTSVCHCGHVFDEHGHDPEFPGSNACNVEGCHCLDFEWDRDAGPEAIEHNRLLDVD